MEVKMNKEIRNYQESMFMGLNLRQCIFFPVCHSCGGRDLFWSGRLCRAGNDRVAVYLRRCSVRSLWVLPVPRHECGAVCLGVYQVRIFIPQRLLFQSEDLYHACMEETLALGEKSKGDGTALMKKREQRARKKQMKQKKKSGRSGAFD